MIVQKMNLFAISMSDNRYGTGQMNPGVVYLDNLT
jgi:hypothetical protein